MAYGRVARGNLTPGLPGYGPSRAGTAIAAGRSGAPAADGRSQVMVLTADCAATAQAGRSVGRPAVGQDAPGSFWLQRVIRLQVVGPAPGGEPGEAELVPRCRLDPPEQDLNVAMEKPAACTVRSAAIHPFHPAAEGRGWPPSEPPELGQGGVGVGAGDDEPARADLGIAPAVENHDANPRMPPWPPRATMSAMSAFRRARQARSARGPAASRAGVGSWACHVRPARRARAVRCSWAAPRARPTSLPIPSWAPLRPLLRLRLRLTLRSSEPKRPPVACLLSSSDPPILRPAGRPIGHPAD